MNPDLIEIIWKICIYLAIAVGISAFLFILILSFFGGPFGLRDISLLLTSAFLYWTGPYEWNKKWRKLNGE